MREAASTPRYRTRYFRSGHFDPEAVQRGGAVAEVSAQPGETVGRVRLSVPRAAVPYVITPVVPTSRARHPRVEVEVVIEERFVDIVAEGYDAGMRLSESIERDMVRVRLTDAFRFVVVDPTPPGGGPPQGMSPTVWAWVGHLPRLPQVAPQRAQEVPAGRRPR